MTALGYFMYQKPKTAKRMWFDVIPKAVDEYHQQLRGFPGQDIDQQLANPVWHVHHGKPPKTGMVVPFAMLLNVATVSHARDKETLWGFIRRYAPDATPEANPDLDAAAGYAVRYYQDRVQPFVSFRVPTEKERAALEDLAARLVAWNDAVDPETLQTMVFAVGTEHGFEPLRDWFTALYEVLLGASQGPRFGGFIALFGLSETVTLIEKALAGKLSAA